MEREGERGREGRDRGSKKITMEFLVLVSVVYTEAKRFFLL